MSPNPFQVKDCNLSLIATGMVAESLIELRDLLKKVPSSSLYHHFWGRQLHTSFVHPEYHNDFAKWADVVLHDHVLKERLAMVDPTDYPDLEELRLRVIDIIEERLDEVQFFLWTSHDKEFHFLRSIIIIFDMGISVNRPSDFKKIIPRLPPTSIFYHFIDARRRTEKGSDDFTVWLSSFGDQYTEIIKKIQCIDPYFLSLTDIRQKLTELFVTIHEPL